MSQSMSTGPRKSRETAAEIEQVAAQWVAHQDRGPLSPEEEARLERWIAADSRRSGAYARAMAISLHLDRVAALGGGFVSDPEVIKRPTRRWVVAATAGAVASAGGAGIFAMYRREAIRAPYPIVAGKGAVREVALREGSRVTLNTMTKVRPQLTNKLRRIDLFEGEALFDVVKDPERPFMVYAGDFSVQAVGTSFTVRRTGPDAIKVLVTEGVVEVSRKDQILGRVHAGIELAVDAVTTPVITNLDPAQISGALAWREGRIDLQGFTLAQAAAEFSRYSDLRINVEDPDIANLHITGIYAAKDPQRFVEDVTLSLGLRSVRHGNTVTISKS